MGLLRIGDPIANPDTDVMVKRGIRYILDTIWTSGTEAREMERRLQMNGKIVYILDRYAPPEESHEHLNMPGDPSIGIPEHLDGRFTHVWEVWVAKGRTYRKKTIQKPKPKRCSCKKK